MDGIRICLPIKLDQITGAAPSHWVSSTTVGPVERAIGRWLIGERFEVNTYAPEHEDIDDRERDNGAPAQSLVALTCQDDWDKP